VHGHATLGNCGTAKAAAAETVRIYLFIYLYIYVSICLSIYLSVYTATPLSAIVEALQQLLLG